MGKIAVTNPTGERKYSELTPAEKLENLAHQRRQVEERERLARAARAELDAQKVKQVTP